MTFDTSASCPDCGEGICCCEKIAESLRGKQMNPETESLAADLDWLAAHSDGWCQWNADEKQWAFTDDGAYDDIVIYPLFLRDDIATNAMLSELCRRYVEGRGIKWSADNYQEDLGYEISISPSGHLKLALFRPTLSAAWVAAVRALIEAEGGNCHESP